MKTGIIGIKFNENSTDTQIQNIISDFYSINRSLISGMEYNEFRDEKTLTQVFEFIAKMDS